MGQQTTRSEAASPQGEPALWEPIPGKPRPPPRVQEPAVVEPFRRTWDVHDEGDLEEEPEDAQVVSVWSVERLQRAGWERGVLDGLLRPHQRPLYSWVTQTELLQLVAKCPRRFGKTFVLLLVIAEMSIKRPGFVTRYAAATEKALRTYVQPNMRILHSTCPADLRPRWNSVDSKWEWPNGSELWLAGTDKDHAEKLRGPGADLVVCDEAGSMTNLAYVTSSILLPQILDRDGQMLIISTPAITPDHDFTIMAAEAEADGRLFKATVEDNSWLKERPQLYERYAKAMGGIHSTAWRREMGCEDVVDESLAIVPEFDTPAEQRIVQAQDRPPYFEPYVVLDPGFSPSNTGLLFGYYDFKAAKLVVEEELELKKMRTDVLAEQMRALEARLWPELKRDDGTVPVIHRWSDIEPILLNDLAQLHRLSFTPTSKDILEVMVNKVRIWVQSDRLRINPRCRSLIAQLKSGIWNNSRSEFALSTRFGHYDLLAALVYMVRNCPETRNPYPAIPHGVDSHTHFVPPDLIEQQRRGTGTVAALRRAFPGWKPTTLRSR